MKVIAKKVGATHIMYLNADSKYHAVELAISKHGHEYTEFKCEDFVRKSHYNRTIKMKFLLDHECLTLQHITSDHRGDFVSLIDITNDLITRRELFNGVPVGNPKSYSKCNEDLLHLINHYIMLGYRIVKGYKGEGR